jgi:signal transduction histidine kinase
LNKSIEKRLLYNFTAITAFVLIVVSLGLSYIINDFFWDSRKRELIAHGRRLAKAAGEWLDSGQRDMNVYLRSVDNFLQARIWLVDGEKRIIASSVPLPTYDREARHGHGEHEQPPPRAYTIKNPMFRSLVDDVLRGETKSVRFFHPYFEDNVITVGLPVVVGGDIKGGLFLNAPAANTERFLHTIYFYIAGVGIIAILLGWWLVKLLSRRIVSPLVAMCASAAAMAKGDYDYQVPITGEDEVADLGRSLNSLARDLANFVDKTQRVEQLRRDFVANVSHELRTPLTIIRGYSEAILDGTASGADKVVKYQNLIRDETMRLEGLIRELLDISRLQARVEVAAEKVPLDVIVKEVYEKFSVKAREKNLTFLIDTEEDSYVNGIGNRLVQLVMILTDNAVKYSKTSGTVCLSVKKDLAGDIVFCVEDDGLGIAEEEQPLIWERFYKVDKSHAKTGGGSGLGLSIAKEIIDIHNARVTLTSKLGDGVKIEIKFTGA